LSAVREGVRRYKALLSLPGARSPVVASALGSLPIGMFGLAILLLARDTTGSFAVAGWIVGAFGLGNAFGAVAQGRLMDRLGQPRVLRPAAVGHVVALAALVFAAGEEAPAWVLTACAAAGGLFLPQVPAAMRSLWGVLVRSAEQRETAYAMVTIAFEVTVMTAPALTALVITVASPSAAVLLGAGIAGVAALFYAATDGARTWRGEPHDVGWVGPLTAPGMRTVAIVLAAFGAAIGVVQVLLPAFADERGSAEAGGLLLALLSGGSLIGGLIYGGRTWPGAPQRRLAVLMLAIGGGWALLAAAPGTAVLAILLVLCGTLLAPTATTASTLLDRVAPAGTVTEAFTVMVMAIVAGTAAGNALGGAIVDGASYEVGALTAAGIAALGSAAAFARRRTLA
jgi:predicted MFS family arabinose efflux permease